MNKRLQMIVMEMKHDRKKFAMMCTLLAVGLLLWARLLILQDVPKTGFADPVQSNTASQTKTTAPEGTENVLLQELPIVYLDTSSQLTRDFFSPLTSPSAGPDQDGHVTRSHPNTDDESSEVAGAEFRERQEAFNADAERLKLESVILGEVPVAVINGKVLRVGDDIDGFVLEKVSARYVVLSRGVFRVDLKMEQPQSGG